MVKIIPFDKIAKQSSIPDLSVIMDKKDIPKGFVFGRDAFISFLEHMDEEFEKREKNPTRAFNNPAGRLIDIIEENLPIKDEFIKDIALCVKDSPKSEWIPLKELARLLHV